MRLPLFRPEKAGDEPRPDHGEKLPLSVILCSNVAIQGHEHYIFVTNA